jgi:glycosyltransferase involved in cell wall biosynthesis
MVRNSGGGMRESAGRVLMFLENRYPLDTRVRNEAETLTKAGYRITVIALRGKSESKKEVVNGVTVYRIPEINLFSKSHKDNPSALEMAIYRIKAIVGYIYEYFYFTIFSFWISLYVLFKDGFDSIHCHNPPDTLFLSGIFYRIIGKKFVFDHHDLSPELYLSRFEIKKEDFLYKILLFTEKLNLKFANVVIATNESYRDIDVKRGKIDKDKVFIVRNGPNLERVYLVPPDEELRKKGKIILGYLGTMGPQDGVDYLLRSLQYLVYEIGRTDFYCVIIGQGDSLEDLKTMARDLKLNDFVWFTGWIPHEDMLRYLSTVDICLDPNPSNPLNDVSTWIKVMEYMALGKPTISFSLKETRFTARDAAYYVSPNKVDEYARGILELMNNKNMRDEMGKVGKKRIQEDLNWSIVSGNLLSAYQYLF